MKRRVSNTVNLSTFEKEHIKKKYRDTYSKKIKPKKAVKTISNCTEEEKLEKNKLPDDVYRYYYFLDISAEKAFDTFCEVMRIRDRDEAVVLLYDKGMQNRNELIDTVRKSTVRYQESIEDKFKFISDKIKEIMFKRLTK